MAPAGRLQPDEPRTRCRDADRATAVIRVRDRHDSSRDERCRTSRGSTHRIGGIPRVTGRLARHELRRGVEPELGKPRLADDGDPGRQDLSGERRVLLCRLGDVGLAAVTGGHAEDLGVVLEIGRHAEKRGVGTGAGAGSVIHRGFDRTKGRVDHCRPCDRRLQQLLGMHRSGADTLRERNRVVITERIIGECMHSFGRRSVGHGSVGRRSFRHWYSPEIGFERVSLVRVDICQERERTAACSAQQSALVVQVRSLGGLSG